MIESLQNLILNVEVTHVVMGIILIVLAVIHVLISQPLSFLSLSVGAIWFGLPVTLLLLGIGYMMGMILFYVIIIKIEGSLQTKKHQKFQKALLWLDETPLYKHTIALGTPLVPTYAIKVMLVLGKNFGHYMIAMGLSYVMLTIINVLLYQGIFVEALLGSQTIVTFVILTGMIIGLYLLPHKNTVT